MTDAARAPLIAIIGRHGQVAWELRRALQNLGSIVVLGSAEMDLADPSSIRATIKSLTPSVIINAAAYTAVDRAEDEQDAARALNATGPAVLSEVAKTVGALLIHFSTDGTGEGVRWQWASERTDKAGERGS